MQFVRNSALIVWMCAAIACQTGAQDATPSGTSATSDPLSGPAVDPAGSGATIVERSFDGSLKRPDVRPEEVALRKLTLSPDERAATDGVLQVRAVMLDGIVRDNVELLLRMQSARAAGNNDAISKVNKEFRDAMRPLAAKGGLAAEISAALEPRNAREFNRMVREYYRAMLTQGRKEMPEGDPIPDGMMDGEMMRDDASDRSGMGNDRGQRRDPRRAEAVKQMLEVFGQEVRRSYERLAAEGQSRLDDVVKRLGLDAEQESKVRALTLEFAQKSLLNPTPAQRAEVFRKVMAELTVEQRRKAVEMLGK